MSRHPYDCKIYHVSAYPGQDIIVDLVIPLDPPDRPSLHLINEDMLSGEDYDEIREWDARLTEAVIEDKNPLPLLEKIPESLLKVHERRTIREAVMEYIDHLKTYMREQRAYKALLSIPTGPCVLRQDGAFFEGEVVEVEMDPHNLNVLVKVRLPPYRNLKGIVRVGLGYARITWLEVKI